MPEASQAGLDGVNADMHGHCHRGFRLAQRAFHVWTDAQLCIGILPHPSASSFLLYLYSRLSSLTHAPVDTMACSTNLKTWQASSCYCCQFESLVCNVSTPHRLRLYGTLRHSAALYGTLGAAVHSLEGHITSLRDLGPDLASAAVDLAENPEALGKRPSTAEGVTWHHSAETTRSSKLWDSWPGS